jgi:hypothetical protein
MRGDAILLGGTVVHERRTNDPIQTALFRPRRSSARSRRSISLRRYCFKNTLTPPWRKQAYRVLVMVQTSSTQRAAARAGAASVQGQSTTCPEHFPQVTRPVGLT